MGWSGRAPAPPAISWPGAPKSSVGTDARSRLGAVAPDRKFGRFCAEQIGHKPRSAARLFVPDQFAPDLEESTHLTDEGD
jgi:hypothetical protein